MLKSSPSGLAVLRQGTVDSIQGLTAEDTLRVDARGPAFFFHINEQMLGQVSDSDYATGGEQVFLSRPWTARACTFITARRRSVRSDTPQLVCNVVAQGLNVRSGPGMTHPSIAIVLRGAQVEPLGRNAAGSWINVRVPGSNTTGWISSAPAFVTCSMAVNELVVR